MSESGKAVFLSYASQDAEAAKKICEALRSSGIEVWFDQSELRGGDAWDQKIRKQIKDCALFVPVISANTQARREGYFRIEWRLAAQRTHAIAEGTPFLMPVVIDETPEPAALVPTEFREVQWTRLSVKDTPESLAVRIGRLLGATDISAARASGGGTAAADVQIAPGEHRAKPKRWVVPTLTAVAVIAIAAFVFRHGFNAKPGSGEQVQDPGRIATAPRTEAQRLTDRALGIADKLSYTRDELIAAEDMTKRATELEPELAAAWGARAWVHATWVLRSWDRAAKRRQDAETFARRGLALDPNQPDALLALGEVLMAQGGAAETERLARQALQARPDYHRAVETLARSLGQQQRKEEQEALLRDRIKRFPNDVLARYQLAQYYIAAWGGLPTAGAVSAALEQMDAALAVTRFGSGLQLKASWLLGWRGDVAGMRATLDELEKLPATERVEDQPLAIALWGGLIERKPERVFPIAALTTRPYLEHAAVAGPKAWFTALAYVQSGQAARAQLEWRAAEAALRDLLRGPDPRLLERGQLAVTLVWLGQREEAARIVAELLPLARAANVTSPRLPQTVAMYYAALGNAAEAVPFLRLALNRNWQLTDYTLPLDPWFDSLKGQPEFEALLQEVAARRKAREQMAGDGGQSVPQTSDTKAVVPPDAKSVAVLAFANLSDDKDNEYFSDGISEELLNVLAKVPGLKVSARTSAFSFKGKGVAIPEIARQLGVAYVVEGSVRKAGNRVRITAQLIKAADGFHVWSDNFDRELKDIFAVQDEIAGLIAKRLSVSFGVTASPSAKPINPEAYQLYLQSRRDFNVTDAGNKEAEQLLLRALALEPNFAKAHAALSDVWRYQVQGDTTASTFAQRDGPGARRLVESAQRAVALDPELAEGRQALGAAYWMSWRFDEAERELRQAVALNPNYAVGRQLYGRVLMALGKVNEGVSELRRATELDPLGSRIADTCGLALLSTGQFEEALVYTERALELEPANDQALGLKAEVLANLGRREEAAAAARSLSEVGPVRGQGVSREARSFGQAAFVFALVGRQAEAEILLEQLKTAQGVWSRSGPLAALGRYEECLATLSPDAIPAQSMERLYYRAVFDPIRRDPRFVQMLREQGLLEAHDRAQAWRAANQGTGDRSQATGKNGLPSVGPAKEGKTK